IHLVLPPTRAVMVPATHSSTPYHEGEDGDAQRPPPDKAENHQRDPGWFSELIDPCCNGHGGASRINVNNIYIWTSNCQEGQSGTTASVSTSSCKQLLHELLRFVARILCGDLITRNWQNQLRPIVSYIADHSVDRPNFQCLVRAWFE